MRAGTYLSRAAGWRSWAALLLHDLKISKEIFVKCASGHMRRRLWTNCLRDTYAQLARNSANQVNFLKAFFFKGLAF